MNCEQQTLDFAATRGPEPTPAPELLDRIAAYLSSCRGPENAATAETIADWIGLSGSRAARTVRHILSLYAERLPFVVCGVPGGGFYRADDPEQMRRYDRLLYSLLKAAAARLAAHRRTCSRNGFARVGVGETMAYVPERSAS